MAEKLCPGGFVVWSILIVDFEVQRVSGDQPEEQSITIEADPAEHSLRGYLAYASELIDDVVEIFFAYRHCKFLARKSGWIIWRAFEVGKQDASWMLS